MVARHQRGAACLPAYVSRVGSDCLSAAVSIVEEAKPALSTQPSIMIRRRGPATLAAKGDG